MIYDYRLLKSFLSLFFIDKIQSLKIISSFDLTSTNEIFIIKLDKPIEEGIIVIGKNFKYLNELVNLRFINLMINENLNGNIFRKKITSKVIYGDELILLEFNNYSLLIQSMLIKKIIFLTSQKIYIPILVPPIPISGKELYETMERIKRKIKDKNYFDILDEIQFLSKNKNGNITELGFFNFNNPAEVSITKDKLHKTMIELLCIFSSLPWDFDGIFNILDDVQVQYILPHFQKRVIPEEFLFFITMCPNSAPKILRNLPKRTLDEILNEQITTHIPYYFEWNRYVLQKKVSRLLEIAKDVNIFRDFISLRDTINQIFSNLYIRDDIIINTFKYLEDKRFTDQFIAKLGGTNLAKVLKNMSDSDIGLILNIIKKYMSKNGFEILLKDLEYFKLDKKDNFESKVTFFNTLLDFYFTKTFLQGKVNIITMADEINDLKVHYASNITSLGSFYLTLNEHNLSYVKNKVLNKLSPRSAIRKYIESALEKKFIIEFGEGITNSERIYNFTKSLFLINKLENLRDRDDFIIY